MTREEIISELLLMARQSEDSAVANEAGAKAHAQEYEAICADPNEVNHDRMSEIYAYVVEWPRQARRMHKEAIVMREAVRLLTAL